ncbi:pyroglutamyl-peptidase I [Glycomyces xiaoerkulensis]|uniref:pyroglutamyl-peptidase I n=1 Tax=Glycomyces xiaoerkulensis TaxID=2038139 RepID=UPI000C26AB93|nr:pyroglutamyl-peptidase I [Glycomyces xiaoerkulensis]
MRRLLLTGFEPFGSVPGNASREAVRAAAERGFDGAAVETALLPVAFEAAPEALEAAIDRTDPDLVLAVGQAEGRRAVTLERVAVNLVNAPIPDNDGEQPVGEPLAPGGPDAYLSNLPLRRCVAAVRAAGVPAAESLTAGSYVCNAVFYRLMRLVATSRPGLLGGFAHVPLVPWQSLEGRQPTMPAETVAAALGAIAEAAFAGSEEGGPPTGGLH